MSTKSWDMAGGLVLCQEAGLAVRPGPMDTAPTWVAAGLLALLPLCDLVGAAARCTAARCAAAREPD